MKGEKEDNECVKERDEGEKDRTNFLERGHPKYRRSAVEEDRLGFLPTAIKRMMVVESTLI
jgi:hypothetical protein